MHKQSRKLSLFMLALLASAVALSVTPVMGSTGYILINTKTAPSSVVEVPAGGNVSLYFGGVTWSGGQFYLLLSKDGFSQKSTGDIAYSATFNVADLTASASKGIKSGDLKWNIGYKWVNGTIPKEIAGGDMYVKAFDGSAAQLAVTDTYITITGAFEVTPDSGPGGRDIELKGYAFAPNKYVNLSYYHPIEGKNHTLVNLLPTNDLGQFTYSLKAPDLAQVAVTGNFTIASNPASFYAKDNSTKRQYRDDYTEYQRGLEQVNGFLEHTPATYLFGNATDFTTGAYVVEVGVGKSLIIAGKYFNPTAGITLWWDGSTQLGSIGANQTGQFNITLTIPVAANGKHNVVIKDANRTNFLISVKVVPSIILSPEEGPVGTTVTVNGYGFSARTSTTVYNVTTSWDVPAKDLGYVLTDSNGHFVFVFSVPHTGGGDHNVTSTDNSTAALTALATFKITALISVSPTEVSNDGTEVTVIGTGLDPDVEYDLDVANQKDFMWIMANETGDVTFKFYAGGFKAGYNPIVLYTLYDYQVASKTSFTVLEESVVLEKLDDILTKLGALQADSTSIKTMITAVQTAVADARSALSTQVTGLSTQLTSIESYAQTASTQATTAASAAQAASTAASGAKTASEAASSATSGITMAVYAAIVLSLIAALASIVAVITLQRKVA